MKQIMIKWMFLIKNGTILQQAGAVILFSTVVTSVTAFMNDYIFPDPLFLKIWLGLIIADAIAGAMRYYGEGKFSPKELFKGIVVKAAVTVLGMFLLKAIPLSLTEVGGLDVYFGVFAKISVLTYVFGSAIGNIYILSGKKFPPEYFMSKWKKFEKDGNAADLMQDSAVSD